MSIPTTERLAQVLHAHGLFDMEAKAREGYYDDFKSPIAYPIVQLVNDLHEAGANELSKRARNGEFDANKEESRAWVKSPEGKATFAELVAGSTVEAARKAKDARKKSRKAQRVARKRGR